MKKKTKTKKKILKKPSSKKIKKPKNAIYKSIVVTYPDSDKTETIKYPTLAQIRKLPVGTMVQHDNGWYVVGATVADIFSD